ncbi:UNVERIFIED_CONTAM: hypothetical protein FKN15_069852 [Acipenser sinensis]
MDDSKSGSNILVRLFSAVPYETLNKRFRAAQKNIDRETSHVTMVVAELEKTLSSCPAVESVVSLLDGVVEKLSALKRKAAESIQAEDESAKLCKRRIEHLKEHSSDQPAAVNVWKKQRMDRMMVEHLLRCGYYSTAVKLARQSGIESLLSIRQDDKVICPRTKEVFNFSQAEKVYIM